MPDARFVQRKIYQMPETLHASVQRVRFHNTETGWTVLVAIRDDTHEAVTIMYQRYVNNAGVFPVFPYEWAPKADSNVFAIAGTMWW